MGPSLSESDFLTIVTFIKGELNRILGTSSSVDSIKTYISNLVKYIEATEQSADLTFSDTEEKGDEGRDPIKPDPVPDQVPDKIPDKPSTVDQEIEALFPPAEQSPSQEVTDELKQTKKTNDIENANGDDDEPETVPDVKAEKVSEIKTEAENVASDKVMDPLTCSGCEKTFETTELLQEHIKRNPGKKRFKCSGCCKAFKHKVSLKLHIVEENHGVDKEDPVEFQKFLQKLAVCVMCNKRFLGQSNLDRHMLTHTGEKPFQCSVCLKHFKQKRSLLMHSEREGHNQENPLNNSSGKKGLGRSKKDGVYRCSKCDRIFSSQNQLNSHMKVHAKGAKFGCNSCGRYFTRKETLEKHITKGCAGDIFPVQVKCGMCDEMFTKKSLLDIHLTKHTSPPSNKEDKAGQQNMENFLNNAESSNFGNDEISALANQIAMGILGPQADGVNATEAGTSQATTQNQTPPKRGRGRRPGAIRPPYQCQYCPKTFNRRKEWRNHQYLHTGEKPHVCDICGKTFRLRQVLSLHIATHGGNKFKCNLCDKTYPYKNQLVRHSYTHSGIKPYKCEQCGKGFISKPELGRHYGVHGGGKSFVCDICGKSCRNIKKHMQSVHSTREKVRCEICRKEYVSKSKLKVHMLTHTTTKAFICPICGKGFAMNKYLSKHMILSHGEKKHKCQLCGKAFAFSQQLKMHERTHTVENPYPGTYYPTYPIGPTFW